MNELFNLEGRTALITGSTRGIGKAIATRMAEHGARVTASSRKPEACEQTAEELNLKFGKGTAIAVPCNVFHKDQLEDLVARTRAAFGAIDILVSNVGVNPHFGPLLDISDSAFERIWRCNVTANLWLSKLVAPGMQSRGYGRIVLISSYVGQMAHDKIGAYGMSQGGRDPDGPQPGAGIRARRHHRKRGLSGTDQDRLLQGLVERRRVAQELPGHHRPGPHGRPG